jgi:hypothetical protein
MTPFKTNQEKKIDKKERDEKKIFLENIEKQKISKDPLLELKVNQPQITQQPQPQIYPSPYINLNNTYDPMPSQYTQFQPWQYAPANIPVIKKFNINLGGINGDPIKVANIYEDILPNEDNPAGNTFNTIKERMIIHNYIRSIFIKTGDGEEVLIGGSNNTKTEITNLLAHIKLLELNPYHFNRLTNNPYKTLPKNFIIYRSCYPIKMNQYNNNIECSKSSIGMNIRIYLLSNYDIDTPNINSNNRYNSDIWRELEYYQFIREELIKTFNLPNFITLHSYYITKNTGINFRKFNELTKYLETRNKETDLNNSKIRNQMYIDALKAYAFNDPTEKVTFEDLIKYKIIKSNVPKRPITNLEREKIISMKIDEEVSKNLYNHVLDSDKCLVVLTEAPTQNLFNWATRTYKIENMPIKKMVNNGYHDEKVWESILFQLLISMIIMINKKIMFEEFSIQNNVYIKDLNFNELNIGIWKYIFNKIEFNVPNYGYILLIDTNFADIENSPHPFKFDKTKIKYKIKSAFMNDKNDKGEIYLLGLNHMINIFNTNIFNKEFTNYGGVQPSTKILKILTNINNYLVNIKNTFFNNNYIWNTINENNFLNNLNNLPLEFAINNNVNIFNNRIGTILKDSELPYKSAFIQTTSIGSIIIKNNTPQLFTFALLLSADITNNEYTFLTTAKPINNIDDRINNIFIKETGQDTDISNYNIIPEPMYEPGKQSNILETYMINI